MTQAEVLDKVRKLLRLSTSSNPHEAANAAAKAQALIDAHHLSDALLSLSGEAPAQPEEPVEDMGRYGADAALAGAARRARWTVQLASDVARANGCRIYLMGGAVHLVGRRSDAETVRYLYAYLAREIDRLALAAGRGLGRTWGNNFRLGAVESVGRRLREHKERSQREAREAAPNAAALVLVNQALATIQARGASVQSWMDTHMKLRKSRGGSGGRWDGSARAAGREAGNGIALGGGARLGSGSARLGSGMRALR